MSFLGRTFAVPAALPPLTLTRLTIGVVQGAVLYFLYRSVLDKAWPATDGYVFAPALIVFLYIPVMASLGAGGIRRRTLVVWIATATVVLIGLTLYDITRSIGVPDGANFWLPRDHPWPVPSASMSFFSVVMLFISHSLVAAGDLDRRAIASYPSYFDAAWKVATQLILATGFVAVFWGVLWLGAALFSLIKLSFFRELITHAWFAVPATTLAVALAIHVTDVRVGLVRGFRTLKLTLLSWLLPLLALIAVGFLASLPFTGLAPLWATKYASASLIGAGALLVLLINAAYQDGHQEIATSRIIRIAGAVGAIVLVPLVVLAGYGLGLRIAQRGWTVPRIGGVATLIVLAFYAVGYASGALARRAWLQWLERCNVWTSFAILAVLLALFTPIADPARIAVADQVARLENRKIPVETFDFKFLRFDAARYGIAALQRLKNSDNAQIAARADEALRQTSRYVAAPVPRPTAKDLSTLTVFPKGKLLPESFLQQDWSFPANISWQAPCLINRTMSCEAVLIDLNGDGTDEIVLIGPNLYNAPVLRQGPNGRWTIEAMLPIRQSCRESIEALKTGRLQRVAPEWSDVELAGTRFRLTMMAGSGAPPCP